MRRVALAMVSATVACSLLTSYEGFDSPRAAPDAADAGEDARPRPCAERRWPAPPARGEEGDVGELVSAFTAVRTINPDWPPFGYDLDGLCSCPEPSACVGARPNEPCDLADAGIDNAAAELFEFFSKTTRIQLNESGLRVGLASGRFSVALRLREWNGLPDDPDVALQVLDVFDANSGSDAGARFDGTDTWVIDEESLVQGKFPSSPVRRAYVSGGVLVADVPTLLIKARVLSGRQWRTLRIVSRSVHLTGKITREGQGFALADGVIAGRLPTADLIRLAVSLGACPGSLAATTLKPILCESRDVPLDPSQDGRGAPCEAVSFGLAFQSGPAKVAANPGTPQDEFECPDAGAIEDCN